jgi:hypothetical protein
MARVRLDAVAQLDVVGQLASGLMQSDTVVE